jgi:hypothetical protein
MNVYWIRLPQHTNVHAQGYVGITHDFMQRLSAHKSCAKQGHANPLYRAIRKHGWDTLVKEVIARGTEAECRVLESQLRPRERIGWNVLPGGTDISGFKLLGTKQSAQHIANRSAALTGRVSGFKGKKHSPEAIEKCRRAHTGKPKTVIANTKNAIAHQRPITINGVQYVSRQEASIITGIPVGSFAYLLAGRIGPRSKYAWVKTITDTGMGS